MSNSTYNTKGQPYPPMFPSWLDEFGLDPYEMRVYIALCRRIVNNPKYDYCFESQPNLAERCKMTDRKLRDVVKALAEYGLIEVQRGRFNTQHIRLLPPPVRNDVPGSSESGSEVVRNDVPTKERQVKEETIKNTSASQKSQGSKSEKKDPYLDYLRIWNRDRRPEWVEHRVLTGRMKGQLRRLEEWHRQTRIYLTADIAFIAALRWASEQRWTHGEKLSLANIGAKDKLIEYAEKAAQSSESKPERVRRNGPAPGDVVDYQFQEVVVTGKRDERGRYAVRLPSGEFAWAYEDELEVSNVAVDG